MKTLITTRNGGVSQGAYQSLNLGTHVGDDPETVRRNREIVQQQVGLPVAYLNQIHSTIVVNAAEALDGTPDADASVDDTGKAVCAVMTADCLPVLFCDRAGTAVAAAHAGWSGLAGGVLQNTIAAMKVPPVEIMAYLGLAISADAFEVGQDVFDAFCTSMPEAAAAFEPIGGGKFLADLLRARPPDSEARRRGRRVRRHALYGFGTGYFLFLPPRRSDGAYGEPDLAGRQCRLNTPLI